MEIVDNLRRRWKNLRSNFWPWLCRASGFGWGLLGVFAALSIGLLSHSAHADALVLAGTLLQVAAVIVLAVSWAICRRISERRPRSLSGG